MKHLTSAAALILACAAPGLTWAADEPRSLVIYGATANAGASGWEIENDDVMGGVSQGGLIQKEGQPLVFHGEVSLENNGGFSSVQYNFEPRSISGYTHAQLRVKGDGKRYQFRVESGGELHAYIHHFETSGEWETIFIPLGDMYPSFHGNRLDLPNYPAERLAQVRFLIANNRAERFRLEVDSITLLTGIER